MAHTVSLHTALMQKQCVAVCAMCASHLLVITVSPSIPWHVPGLATCSVFASPCPLMPRKPLKFSALFYVSARPSAAWGLQEFVRGLTYIAKKLSVIKHESGFFPPGHCFPICFHPSDQFWPKFCQVDLCRPAKGTSISKKIKPKASCCVCFLQRDFIELFY